MSFPQKMFLLYLISIQGFLGCILLLFFLANLWGLHSPYTWMTIKGWILFAGVLLTFAGTWDFEADRNYTIKKIGIIGVVQLVVISLVAAMGTQYEILKTVVPIIIGALNFGLVTQLLASFALPWICDQFPSFILKLFPSNLRFCYSHLGPGLILVAAALCMLINRAMAAGLAYTIGLDDAWTSICLAAYGVFFVVWLLNLPVYWIGHYSLNGFEEEDES